MRLKPSQKPVVLGWVACTIGVGILMGVGTGIFAFLAPAGIFVVLAMGFATMGLLTFSFLGLAFGRFITTYTVDETGITKTQKFLDTRTTQVPWRKVSLVAWSEGPIERRLGLHNARISAYGATGTVLSLEAIEEPALWRQLQDTITANASRASWLGED